MRMKCRVWWPKQLSSSCEPSSSFLFGWFLCSSPASLDIIVAFTASPDERSLSAFQSSLQGILHYTNGKMPVLLQDKSAFSILGQCAADCRSNGQLQSVGMKEEGPIKSPNYSKVCPQDNQDIFGENYGRWSCGCHKLDRISEQYRQASIRNCNWIQMYCSHGLFCKEVHWMPKLHHIHWNGQVVSLCDVQVIIYELPTFGAHHFSLSSWVSSEQAEMPLKKPKWVDELHQKNPLPDLDTAILAINSATYAKTFFESYVAPKTSTNRIPTVCMLVAFVWHLIAVFLASFFTLFYAVLQFFHSFLSYGSQSLIYLVLAKVFSHTWKNVQIRCCQILYWPTFLQDSGLRSQSSVEYAERAALHKHSMWSNVAVDVLLGIMVGLALLYHAEAASFWVFNLVNDVTNNLLRLGCVWLMGVPAGFKLNTELAGVVGMMSLNVIQIWSALWFFLGFLSMHFIRGLAMSGMVLGVTIPAALIIDMIELATLHVSTLHRLISLLYSHQIQALAALWRLFRGQKWNPLRQRLDSYNYTVEQHIVGSLLFTPLLLLLPTTSVFYIFFTIMNTSIRLVCILIEVTISILHATPYIKIFLCLVRPRRFPSGMWFEIISGQSNALDSPEIDCPNDVCSPSENSQQRKMEENNRRPRILVSFLRSNYLNIVYSANPEKTISGQIVLPHYRNVFCGISASIAASAYGVLVGKRIPSTLGTGLPSTMPWMSITYREYWRLCHDSVLACKADCD
ncbi:hypothetical protein HHK36_011427 [Tetracentron sinense]|uniref:Uncharacterized protein n=1 Tax=Tetracentron sinense TaxID=13715 RepID=A0A834ZAD8_TETSI|nr:hypothetical protein HHK36_011427 [Tetracentron sinense]